MFALVAAIPGDAQGFFFSCIGTELLDWRKLILSMNAVCKSQVLNLIAASLVETNEKVSKRELIQAASEKAQLVVIFQRNFPKIGFENLAITAVLLSQF